MHICPSLLLCLGLYMFSYTLNYRARQFCWLFPAWNSSPSELLVLNAKHYPCNCSQCSKRSLNRSTRHMIWEELKKEKWCFLLRHIRCIIHRVLKEDLDKKARQRQHWDHSEHCQWHIFYNVQSTKLLQKLRRFDEFMNDLSAWLAFDNRMDLLETSRDHYDVSTKLLTTQKYISHQANAISCMYRVTKTHHKCIPNEKNGIYKVSWQLIFAYDIASFRYIAKIEDFKDRMRRLSFTKKLRCHCWSCSSNGVIAVDL